MWILAPQMYREKVQNEVLFAPSVHLEVVGVMATYLDCTAYLLSKSKRARLDWIVSKEETWRVQELHVLTGKARLRVGSTGDVLESRDACCVIKAIAGPTASSTLLSDYG